MRTLLALLLLVACTSDMGTMVPADPEYESRCHIEISNIQPYVITRWQIENCASIRATVSCVIPGSTQVAYQEDVDIAVPW